MNHTDQELEAAILAYRKEHGEWPKKAVFSKQMKVAYSRVRAAVIKVQDMSAISPASAHTGIKISIPADVQSSFQEVWEKASRESALALEAAKESYSRKISELCGERDELAEAFEQSNVDLASLIQERDNLHLRFEETCLKLSETQEQLKAAELRASAYIETAKALGLDFLKASKVIEGKPLGLPIP